MLYRIAVLLKKQYQNCNSTLKRRQLCQLSEQSKQINEIIEIVLTFSS